MKNLNKVLVLVLSAIMVLAMSASVFAQTVAYEGEGGDGAKITITNAAKGETYKVAKLFDATVTGKQNGSIAYQGNIPNALSAYFTKDATTGEIKETAALDFTNADVQAAFKSWAESNVTAQAKSDGSTLEFTNLPYGYYIITTTQGEAKITVNSTNPIVEVRDKNTTPPVGGLSKKVNGQEDEEKVSIGQELTYTVTFTTANYDSAGNQIDKYVITDTLPNFLTVGDNAVQSIKITAKDGTETDVTTQFTNKKIELTWAQNGQNLYDNGATVTITYKATVNANIQAGNVSNSNEVTVTPYHGGNASENDGDSDTAVVKTYAVALQKVDESGKNLAGATFQIPGLHVTGSAGNYDVVSYDPTSSAAGDTMACDDNGLLVIRGIVGPAAVSATEVAAPDGYNKLEGAVELTPVLTQTVTTVTSTSSTKTIYYDSEGRIVDEEVTGGSSKEVTISTVTTNDDLVSGAAKVENKKGTVLPGTGGIGTTIFYILGSLLVIGCGVVLISRKRMQNNK